MTSVDAARPWNDAVRLAVVALDPGDHAGVVARAAAEAPQGSPLLLGRSADRRELESPALHAVLGHRLATTPALTALALAPCAAPRAATTPVLPEPVLTGVVLWPAAVAVRAAALRLLLPVVDGVDDPIGTLVELLTTARAGLEWRAHPLSPRRPAEPAAWPRLGVRVEQAAAGLDPRLAEPEPWPHLELGWVMLRRVATAEGHRRLLAPGEEPAPGEFPDGRPALVRALPGPGTVPVFGTAPRSTGYAPEGAPGEVPAGYVHEHGLPSGAEVVVFHDPRLAHDFVGLGEEDPPGCHVSRILGWALAVGRATAVLNDPPPPHRRVLRRTAGGHVSDPLTLDDGAVGPGAQALVHAAPGPDRVALYAARSPDGRPTLTVDPFEAELTDLRPLGWIARGGTARDPTLWRAPAGRVMVTAATVAGAEPLGQVERVPGAFDSDVPTGDQDGEATGPSLVVAPVATPDRRSLRRRAADWRRGRRGTGTPRTLILAPWFSVGGGDRFLLDLIRILEGEGRWVGAALTIPAEQAPVDASAEFAPHLRRLVRVHEDRPDVAPVRAVAELIRDERVDQLFICGGAMIYPHLGPLRAAFPHLRVVDQLFNDVGHLAANTAAAEHIDLTICAYEGLHDGLVQGQGRPADRVAVAYIGIDTGTFRPVGPAEQRAARRALGLDPDRETWGYLGRISEEKCLPHLVEALRRLGPGLPVQVIIQGDGPAAAEVRRAVTDSGLPIVLRGFAPDVRQALAALDVYVLPSRIEGIPLAVMEAMASGVLPVATAVGGVPELVHTGAEGYLVAPGDPVALALGLQAAWRTPAAAREQMRQAARRAVDERMSKRAMAQRYLELIGR